MHRQWRIEAIENRSYMKPTADTANTKQISLSGRNIPYTTAGHFRNHDSLARTILQAWLDSIKEWTGQPFGRIWQTAEERDQRRARQRCHGTTTTPVMGPKNDSCKTCVTLLLHKMTVKKVITFSQL